MKKELKIRKDEPIYDWLNRIQKHYKLSNEMRDILREVSIVSYTAGSNAVMKIMNNIRK